MSKPGFKTKMRGIYIAEKSAYKPQKGVNALIGAVTQYNIGTSNSILPRMSTYCSYLFGKRRADYRRNLHIMGYRKRKADSGGKRHVLNIEELATIWHFPMSHVKTPLVQKVTTKRTEPPADLPVDMLGGAPPLPDGVEPPGLKPVKPGYQTDTPDIGYPEGTKFG